MIFILAIASLIYAGVSSPTLTPMEQLGKALFFDNRLSDPEGMMSCASCHAPEVGFTGPDSNINKHGAVYEGAVSGRFGNRKPPSAAYAGDSPILKYKGYKWVGGMFWDGRATGGTLGDPLAEQAQGPFLNPLEQNIASAQAVLQQIAVPKYEELWKAAFGESSWPIALSPENYNNVGRAIAAYERSPEVSQFTSKYDYWLKGEAKLTGQELNGLALFRGKGKCASCHTEPLFTDFTYDNLGVPKNPENPFYQNAAYNPEGESWIDPGLGGFLKAAGYPEAVWSAEWGKHKVPTLRNVDKRPGKKFTKAYMHNGFSKSLQEVVHFYNTIDVPGAGWPLPEVAQNINTTELGNLGLTKGEENAIVAFMATLSDGYIPTPKDRNTHKIASLEGNAPEEIQVYQNSPNPFNPTTSISFAIPGSDPVQARLLVFDLRGALVRELVNGIQTPGIHTVEWDAADSQGRRVSSGIYLYTLEAGSFTQTRKMIFLR